MTPHVLAQLPSWVEGDLEATDLAGVERHLAQCPACRSTAEALRASQSLLREALASPFGTPDRVRLRQRVMDQLRAETPPGPVRRLVIRPALLAACAALLLIGLLTWRQGSSEAIPLVPPMAPPVATERPALPLPSPTTAARGLPPRPAAQIRPAPRLNSESPPRGEPARIEFQTADPTIRIIWLAQAKSLSDPTAPTPEEP